jgi:hypothetical protein
MKKTMKSALRKMSIEMTRIKRICARHRSETSKDRTPPNPLLKFGKKDVNSPTQATFSASHANEITPDNHDKHDQSRPEFDVFSPVMVKHSNIVPLEVPRLPPKMEMISTSSSGQRSKSTCAL